MGIPGYPLLDNSQALRLEAATVRRECREAVCKLRQTVDSARHALDDQEASPRGMAPASLAAAVALGFGRRRRA